MKRLVVIIAALVLTGCAHKAVQVRTVEVPVIRVTKCLAEQDIPSRPSDLGKRSTSNARILADLLLAKVRQWEAYGDKADAVLKGCAG